MMTILPHPFATDNFVPGYNERQLQVLSTILETFKSSPMEYSRFRMKDCLKTLGLKPTRKNFIMLLDEVAYLANLAVRGIGGKYEFYNIFFIDHTRFPAKGNWVDNDNWELWIRFDMELMRNKECDFEVLSELAILYVKTHIRKQ